MSLRCDGRNQTKAEARSCSGRDDRRLANLAPCSARVMIRAHVRSVDKENQGVFPLRERLDPRIFRAQPLLRQRLVAFNSTMQWLLTTDAKLRQ